MTKDRQKIYQAAMMDPAHSAELNIKDIQAMCDELIEHTGLYEDVPLRQEMIGRQQKL